MTSHSDKGLTIVAHKGFQIRFDNGYAASVLFGPCNYCESRGNFDYEKPERDHASSGSFYGGTTAEVAVLDQADDLLRISDDSALKGRVSPEDVATLVKFVSDLPTGLSHEEASKRVREALL